MSGGQPDDDTLGGLVVQLAEDARAYARAEIDYYRAMALARLSAAKMGAAFALLALLIAHAAVIALVVGSVFALAPQVGPVLAIVIVVVTSLIVAAILGWLGARGLSRAFGPLE